MTIIKTLKLVTISIIAIAAINALLLPHIAGAAPTPSNSTNAAGTSPPPPATQAKSDNTKCDQTNTNQKVEACINSTPIVKTINTIINFLASAVAIVIVAMIIIGGIQYMAAGDNANAVQAARKRISNAVLAFVAFLLLFSFVQWLVPGGIFR